VCAREESLRSDVLTAAYANADAAIQACGRLMDLAPMVERAEDELLIMTYGVEPTLCADGLVRSTLLGLHRVVAVDGEPPW
jgi:hypothetical protein